MEPPGSSCPFGQSVVMMFGAMSSERVVGEVAARGTPHGVDVIGVASGVVVLDEDRRPVQSVVVRLARVECTRPQHMDVVECRPGKLRGLLVGDTVRKTGTTQQR